MMNHNKEILLNKGEGSSFWVLGDLYTFKVTGKETNDAFTIIDQVIAPQGGPPPHIHHREDEAFYILEGRFSFLCGEEQRLFEAGSFVYIPKGTLHTFRNAGDTPGRLLVTITPAGLENFFFAIGTPAAGSATPPPFDPAVIDRLMGLARKFEMDVMMPDNG